MAVPFGFSFGDFVAGIGLIKDLVGALRDSGGSGEQFRAVLSELETLRTALEAIQTLDVDDSLTSERFALHYAASLCQRTILDFREKITKYNTVLRVGGSGSRFKDSYRKVQWALRQKDDVEDFRIRVNAHTASISVMLVTLSMKDNSLQQKRQEKQSRSIMGRLQIEACNFMRIMNTIAGGVADIVGKTSEIFLHKAFKDLLKARFENDYIGTYLDNDMLELRDPVTSRAIEFQNDWKEWFVPGQSITMSLVRSEPFEDSMDTSWVEQERKEKQELKVKFFSGYRYQTFYTVYLDERGQPIQRGLEGISEYVQCR